jgi:hypothetical protein
MMNDMMNMMGGMGWAMGLLWLLFVVVLVLAVVALVKYVFSKMMSLIPSRGAITKRTDGGRRSGPSIAARIAASLPYVARWRAKESGFPWMSWPVPANVVLIDLGQV